MHREIRSPAERPTRLPDGYAKLLYDHQYRAKKNLQEEDAKVTSPLSVKPPARPDRELYQHPGIRGSSSEPLSPEPLSPEPLSPEPLSPEPLSPEPLSPEPLSPIIPEVTNPTEMFPRAKEVITLVTEAGHTLTLDMGAVDVESYIEEARDMIRNAVKDPSVLLPRDLEVVAQWVVNRAWEDPKYYRTAADLCVFIAEKEKDSEKFAAIPQFAFQRSLCVCCAELMENWDKMRAANTGWWHSYVQYIMYTFRLLSEHSGGLGGLCTVMYDVINALLTPLCTRNAIEDVYSRNNLLYTCQELRHRELLLAVMTSCGKHLQRQNYTKMDDLAWRLRDMYLEATDDKMKELLLQVIELRAANWELSQTAVDFYATQS